MRCRDVYLRIETVPAYSPVAPDDAEHDRYRRDCMRTMGHEDTTIPPAEEARRRLDAVVYRRYRDPGFTIPDMSPMVAPDIHEPRWERRVPGTVLYAEPGERLRVHVRNDHTEPHSLHVHGLDYGIDSDGSWPFGVTAPDGRRSDAICPGEQWCYVLDVPPEAVGAWPFHDHVMSIQESVDRGLFGGIVVRDPEADCPEIEIPFFLHRLIGAGGTPAFDSGTLNGGDTFTHAFPTAGTYDYVCRFHPMIGTVRVNPTGAATASVAIVDSPVPGFQPADVTIGVGGVVTWTHAGTTPHTVSDAATSPLDTFAINGRAFVGNTPTIIATSGQRVRWYVFNLDLGERWHNFHTHGQRFGFAGEMVDTRTIGPAESFTADTVVPQVLVDPSACEKRPPRGRKRRYCLRGDFLVHCHVEMHMMHGMVAVIRAVQQIELTDAEVESLGFALPLASPAYCKRLGHDHDDHGHAPGGGHGGHGAHVDDDCPDIDPHPCHVMGTGGWERLADLDIFVVHAAVLHTGKVLLWSGTAEVGDPLESRVWDPATDTRTGQAYGEDLFCSGHAFMPDGRLCVAGGAPSGTLRSTHIFDPVSEAWTKKSDMAQARWYPTVLTLPDGRILAVSGTGANEVEIYDAAADTWTLVTGATRVFPELYPSLHLLPTGEIFYSRCGWAMADTVDTASAYLRLTGPAAGSWTPQGLQQFHDRQEGTALLRVDATVSPPAAQVHVFGGGVSGAAAARNPQCIEWIDLTALSPTTAWETPPRTMLYPRTNVNGVWLPDGTVFVVGGQRAGKWNADPQPVLEAEIYDPVTGTTTVTPPMGFPRQYHSVAVLLPDGRVLCAGGIDPMNATERDLRSMELFSPPYLSAGSRPQITATPAVAGYGATVTVSTPDAASVAAVTLISPNSVTHHTDAGHRYILLPIAGVAAGSVDVTMPATAAIAPPGYYMLFLVDGAAVPSEARFVQLH